MLNESEEALVQELGFDEELCKDFKKLVQEELERVRIYDNDAGEERDVNALGCALSSDVEDSDEFFELLEEAYEKGYTITTGYEYGVCLLKGTSAENVLTTLRTEPGNSPYTRAEIIGQLNAWERRFGIRYRFATCSVEYFALSFEVLPSDIPVFLIELFEFAPDVEGDMLEIIREDFCELGFDFDSDGDKVLEFYQKLSSGAFDHSKDELLAESFRQLRYIHFWWD